MCLPIAFLVAITGVIGFSVTAAVNHYPIFVQPEQIHLSLSADDHSMVVTWSTPESTKKYGGSFVQFGSSPNNLQFKSYANESKFIDGGIKKSTWYIHRAKMANLLPSQMYCYKVGNNLTMSAVFYFKSLPKAENTTWSPHIVLFGDMGNKNARSMTRLQNEAQEDLYDMVIHVGDFAYDMDTDDAKGGDEFMKQIQPIASYVPYMTCPGNHEQNYNFSNYRYRFAASMPQPRNQFDDMFYSFNIGPIHFVSISTEYYYYTNYGIHQLIRQYHWVVQDLAEANKPENRRKHPWIIMFGHRPMYCTGKDKDDCSFHETKLRVGIEFVYHKYLYGMERVLREYSVDVAIWAHEHYYERFWPLYDYRVYNGSYELPYTNPGAPIHIISGSAGCDEEKEEFKKEKPPYSAFRNNDYGYTRLKAHNKTHLEFSQVSDEKDGKIVDNFFIIKEPKF